LGESQRRLHLLEGLVFRGGVGRNWLLRNIVSARLGIEKLSKMPVLLGNHFVDHVKN